MFGYMTSFIFREQAGVNMFAAKAICSQSEIGFITSNEVGRDTHSILSILNSGIRAELLVLQE
jgi:hypothetical protein